MVQGSIGTNGRPRTVQGKLRGASASWPVQCSLQGTLQVATGGWREPYPSQHGGSGARTGSGGLLWPLRESSLWLWPAVSEDMTTARMPTQAVRDSSHWKEEHGFLSVLPFPKKCHEVPFLVLDVIKQPFTFSGTMKKILRS